MSISFTFKHKNAFPTELQDIDPFLGIVFYAFVSYAKENDLPVNITRVFAPVEKESGIHQDGRGIDISSRGWTSYHILKVVDNLNKSFNGWGTSPDGKNTRVIIHHVSKYIPGARVHFHLQVRRYLTFEKNLYNYLT